MTKEHGRLNLSTMQFKWFMNIFNLEGVPCGLHKAKEAIKDSQVYYKYDILIYKEEIKLAELTEDLTPDLLRKKMSQFSD